MKYFAIINLVCLLLINLSLFTGCKTEKDSTILTNKQNLQSFSQDSCEGKFNGELTNQLLEKVETNVIENEDYAGFLLNPQWTKRLGDDAVDFINTNEQLNKQKASLLQAKTFVEEDGMIVSPCQMEENGIVNLSIAKQRNIQSNFQSLVKSYNETVQKRNENYEEKIKSFQKDFQGTNFTNKQKKSVDKSVDKEFLMKLYQSRIKHLLNISRG